MPLSPRGGRRYGGVSARLPLRNPRGQFVKSPAGGLSFFDTLGPSLLSLPAVTLASVNAVMEFYAEEIESWMKDNAPWEDRTGEAREGLTAEFQPSATEPKIVLYHSVDYGVWLEVRWNGEYAIIGPAMEHFSGQLMQDMSIFE